MATHILTANDYMDKLKEIIVEQGKNLTNNIQFKKLSEHVEEMKMEEIGSIYSNFVVRLYYDDKETHQRTSVVAKIAPPYSRINPSLPNPPERLAVECRTQQKFDDVYPGCVPKLHHFSEKYHIVLMEDLDGYQLLRYQHLEGHFDINIVTEIAIILAKVHNSTHVSVLSPEDFQHNLDYYRNDSGLNTMVQALMTIPYDQDLYLKDKEIPDSLGELTMEMWRDGGILESVAKLRKIYSEKKECLLHGDYHPGNTMIKDNNIKVFDAEYSFIGAPAYDMGCFVGFLLFLYYKHKHQEPSSEQSTDKVQYGCDKASTAVKAF